MQALHRQIERVARTDATVLIRGERGTGKELVANALQQLSRRSGAAYVKINCATFPGELLASELFGHERGAFTGALERRPGLFTIADGGTLFADEIGNLSLEGQAMLLRAIEQGEVRPVGAKSATRVDVRLVAATNKDLERAISEREFLSDLHDRLSEVVLEVSPLRSARTLDDQRRLGQLSVYMCHNLWITGHPTEALGFGQSAQAIAEALGDVPLQVTANLYFGAACMWAGDYRRAEELLRKVLRLLEGDLSRERLGLAGFPAVMARFYVPWVFAHLGKFNEGIVHAQEGVRLAEALDHPYSLANVCWILGTVQLTRGELSHAVQLFDRCLALSREWNLTYLSAMGTGSLGYAYALSGRTAEGLALLEHALSAVETMGFGAFQPPFLVYLGEAYVLADRVEEALAFAGRALTLARERGQRGYEAWALRLLGEATTRRDPPGRADGHYRDALALAEELGMRPLVAHCHLGLGKLYRRTGELEQAREHLATATTMYREMGMTYWLERAESELKD